MSDSGRMPAEVAAALHEYDSLRAEVLDLERRNHQLLSLSAAAAGAVVYVAGQAKLTDLGLAYLFLATAGLIGLVAISAFGHLAKMLEFGSYLQSLAHEVRWALFIAAPSQGYPDRILGWEDLSLGSMGVKKDLKSGTLWGAFAMETFEMVALVAIPIAFFVGGSGMLVINESVLTAGTVALAILDFVVAVAAASAALWSVVVMPRRDRAARQLTVLASAIEWVEGPWEGLQRLSDAQDAPERSAFAAEWLEKGTPPASCPVDDAGEYRLDARPGWPIRYRWVPRAGSD